MASKKKTKKRRQLQQLLAAPVVIILAALVVLLFAITRPSISDPVPFETAQEQARLTDDLPACLELRSQDVPDRTRQEITRVVEAKLVDVPIGIAHAVFFASYDGQKVAGTIAYDGIGNTFNYEASHAGGTWKLHAFEACETK